MPNRLEEKTREREERGKEGSRSRRPRGEDEAEWWRRGKGGEAEWWRRRERRGKKENTKQSGGEDDSAEGKKEKTREKFSPLSVIFFPQESDGWFICPLASTAGEGEDADAISPLLCKFALAASTAGEGEDADAISPLLCYSIDNMDAKRESCGVTCVTRTTSNGKIFGRKYFRCPRCQRFVMWVDQLNQCPCGAEQCKVRTAKTTINNGRQFRCCPRSTGVDNPRCGLFEWLDTSVSEQGGSTTHAIAESRESSQ